MNSIIKVIAGVAMMATLLFIVSCSDDDDNNKSSKYLKMGNDARPSWTVHEDIYKNFEFTMSIQATLQDVFKPYISDEDMMCATVDGEIRAVSNLLRTGGEPYFALLIAGGSGSGSVSISYYCSKLKRIYTVKDWKPFSPSIEPTQNGKPYIIMFIPDAQ